MHETRNTGTPAVENDRRETENTQVNTYAKKEIRTHCCATDRATEILTRSAVFVYSCALNIYVYIFGIL